MDYLESINYLRDFEKLGYKFRVENTRELLEQLGFDFQGLIVHVGGTNGKGSAACCLNFILQRAGKSVGFYSSPELIDFTERIRIDNRQITHEQFSQATQQLKPLVDQMSDKPTFFEATTALALKHFADNEVDAMVLEVGMGGRLDSTNAVESDLAIVTNVELDHTRYLGDSISQIAHEKAGIVSDDSILVTGASGEAYNVLEKECRMRNSEIIRVGLDATFSNVDAKSEGTSFKLETKEATYDLKTPMRGHFQAQNVGCAVAAAEILGISKEHITSGVNSAYWPGRLDLVQMDPAVILDSAHNPNAISESRRFIDEAFTYDRLITVCGFSEDKDYATMLAVLSESDEFIATRSKNDRSLETSKIIDQYEGKSIDNVEEAVDRALSLANIDDLVLVTGSIYVVGEAIGRWRSGIDL